MSLAAAADEFRHPAVCRKKGRPLAAARLTDRERCGVLLQGAAVLSHLEQAGWSLTQGWSEAAVTSDGALVGLRVRPGRRGRLNQELLLDLVRELFGTDGQVAGRGEARRLIRDLLDEWQQSLIPLSADEAVGRILETAAFLWERRFDPCRQALVGLHTRRGSERLWVAGPGPCRCRLLKEARTQDELLELLCCEDARHIWEGTDDREPALLMREGRWREAATRWRRQPPASPAERLEFARALFALGRFGEALRRLRGLRTGAAGVLRASCHYYLGKLSTAAAILRRLGAQSLSGVETVEAAELATRVLGNIGEPEEVEEWVSRALALRRGPLQLRGRLVAAGAAWDRGDLSAMDHHLAKTEGMAASSGQAWRWHQVVALRAMAAGDGCKAAQELRRALAARRRLFRFHAAALWNDLGVARAQAGDLAGAERAFLHAVSLFGGCEGPRRTTLALYNLAEVRLRRGRLRGVREILERSTVENRLAGNLRGGVQDLELWARYELVVGRPKAALIHCEDGLRRLQEENLDWRRGQLRVLAARALGWTGDAEEAAEMLTPVSEGALTELEEEERPALLAHAGDREGALQKATGTAWEAVWYRILTGQEIPSPAWNVLETLEPYRAARLVFDCELTAPGAVPAVWRRRAIATLRRLGASALAELLEARETGPWQALTTYLKKPAGQDDDLESLFRDSGYSEVRLIWDVGGRERVLVAGCGGGEELVAPLGSGTLSLSAPTIDAPLHGFFVLALRRLTELDDEAPDPAPATGGIIGDCAALRQALVRLERFAPGDLPVLILGESGTGKELAARQIHRLSRRCERSFLPINCAALPENLVLSELFGHVRGAFTGADRNRAGIFETAQGGTVFLDEIGDLPPAAQGMLLRVLQEGELRRVGESLPRRVDVRLITATHRDLEGLVREGGFRQDLFYRLKVAAVELPPLRERGGDILLLARHFLARTQDAGKPPRLSSEARRLLLSHPWPGNVRELENVLRVAATLARGRVIEAGHLDLPAGKGARTDYHQQVEAFRRRLVAEALAAADGNRAEAARRLGLSRQALSYLVRQLKLV